MSTHASALGIGHKLQEYIIGRLLGHGGFGLTYLAQDTNLNSLVAIKEFLPQEFAVRTPDHSVVPKSEFDADSYKWGLDRFKEEARALARFKHPNIVRVSRLLEANGTAYMVMDFEPGMTLSQYLKRHGPTLDEGRLLGMFLPVLDGLEALHRLQLVHRDIKPSNIYVRAYGGPMLIDFGAVRQAIGAQSRSLTSLVTPGYAPIEQYSSDGRQGAWSDLYAVGATIYYCMFGHAPADAAKRSAAISDGSEDPYAVAMMRGAETYSRELLECVDWALQFRVRDRPQSAQELRERLRSSPVPPQIIEVPESLKEVPELQHGVASAPTLPSPTNRTETVLMVRDRGAATGSSPPTGDATVVSSPTSHGVDSWAPFIEGKISPALPRRPFTAVLREHTERLWRGLKGALDRLPKPDLDNPSTLTGRVALYVREPRGVRIVLSALIMLVLATSLIVYMRRLDDDEHLYKAALAANTDAGYQDYLQHCGRCAHKAEAGAARVAMQKVAQLAALDAEFKALLAKKALVAPADPNASALLQQMQALAPEDPVVKDAGAQLDETLKRQKEALAAEQKKLATERLAAGRATTRRSKPGGSSPAATAQSSGGHSVAPPVQAAPNEVLPQPRYTPAPRYPIGVKGVTGWVDVEFTVNIDGSVTDIRVLDSQPKGTFDDAAMHAVHNWLFIPATLDGSRERKRIHMRVDFKP